MTASARVLPLVAIGDAALDVSAALAWFVGQGAGPDLPVLETLPAVEIPHLGRFASEALTRGPASARQLAAEVLDALGPSARQRVGELGERLIIVVPSRFRAHCWTLPGGARAVEGGRWCRRYCMLPTGCGLAIIVHELGHLLFDWPDLERDSGLGSECLMARGALLPEPAPPCAVLRLRAGWISARVPERGMRVRELEVGEAVVIGERVIERRCDPDRLLVLLDKPRPLLLRRIELRTEDLDRPLLAVARFG